MMYKGGLATTLTQLDAPVIMGLMLTATFVHAQGIGPVTERRLWEAGILSWEQALATPASSLPLSAAQRALLLPTLEESVCALERGDARYFARVLPAREHWRAVPHFADRIGFLDIETNGGLRADSITVIGVYDNVESRIYVKYQDLDQFADDAERFALWVTFFGNGFDLPLLRRRFPHLAFDQLHVDLCPALRRLGLKGGLKQIERRLNIRRPPEVEGLDGWHAVQLWRQWRRAGDEDALRLLLAYNREDIENLSLLLAFAYQGLKAASGFPL